MCLFDVGKWPQCKVCIEMLFLYDTIVCIYKKSFDLDDATPQSKNYGIQ